MKNLTRLLWSASLLLLSSSVFAASDAPADESLAMQLTNPAVIEQGKYLARVGDCVSCHTAADAQAFAGGHALRTSFGTIYAPNITPDAETGIGDWAFDDFWQALHNGIGPDGKPLYPAFSYTSFTLTKREDAVALFAYLKSLPPIRKENKAAQMRFPYNLRSLLHVWRALYFTAGEYQPDTEKSEQWNRGAYLVKGLGHCNECHTTRNALGAMNSSNELSGGAMQVQGWYAPNLSTQKGGGLDGWTNDDIIQLLRTGLSDKGGVFGPMADVVHNSTQYMTDDDLQAVAVYLQALPAPENPPLKAGSKAPDYAAGKATFDKHCSACHGDDGEGHDGIYPPLVGNSTVTEPSGTNAIRSVLLGGFPPVTKGNPEPYSMPPYAGSLSDKEIAAVVNYIRQSWGNQGTAVDDATVTYLRNLPMD